MFIYDVIAKRHEAAHAAGKSDVCLFYDENREESIRAMHNYCKTHGFSIDTPDGTFSIADLILRERTPTGEVISETPYRQIFDVYGNRIVELKPR